MNELKKKTKNPAQHNLTSALMRIEPLILTLAVSRLMEIFSLHMYIFEIHFSTEILIPNS